MNQPDVPLGYYRHFKGAIYRVAGALPGTANPSSGWCITNAATVTGVLAAPCG